jgi:hypothetical protein
MENMEEVTLHVECVDCHNPHIRGTVNAKPPVIPGYIAGVSGIDSSGNQLSEAKYEYQVCYKCHGVSSNDTLYVDSPSYRKISRQVPQSNIRLQFRTSNISFHPVEGPGKNHEVPSLISPLTTNSQIYCIDCHNNDGGPGAGGTGPRGPHGSNNPFLLERNLDTGERVSESPGAYALCYKCHDRQSILNNESFAEHKKHIVEGRTPCTICHDPHGVPNQSNLINFKIDVVYPPKSGNLRFEDLGHKKGRCFLKCHDNEHNPKEY